MSDDEQEPQTEAGKRLYRMIGHYELDDSFLRDTLLTVEREAFWQGVTSVEEVSGPVSDSGHPQVPTDPPVEYGKEPR
jgi:hypothetical protein